ncbi:MAG: hypothetical protein K2K89_05300, partial [Ruminococcus sp.]|nr:hypothetical protein [Ruminococcus sp.]
HTERERERENMRILGIKKKNLKATQNIIITPEKPNQKIKKNYYQLLPNYEYRRNFQNEIHL